MKNGHGRLTPAFCLAFSTLCSSLLIGAGAHAQIADGATAPTETPAPAGPALTANASIVSQYVSRGVRQTWDKPAVQAGVDYVHPSGWSAGTWVSTISDRFVEKGTVEWDIYGGYSGAVGEIGYSALAYYYKYPRAVISATGTKFDYAELSGGLTYKSLYAKYNYTVTRDFFGITNARGTGYLDVGANHELADGWTLNLHAGDGRVAGDGNDIWNWRDAKAGVTKTLGGGWSAAIAYTRAWGRTDVYKTYTTGVAKNGVVGYSDVTRGTLVAAVTRTF